MSPPKYWHQKIVARFPEGTFEKMDALALDKEKRADFIRCAVGREIWRREEMRAKRAARLVPPIPPMAPPLPPYTPGE